MARVIVLDAGPLGLACIPPGRALANACRAWLLTLELGGVLIAIPEIVDYEVRRELIRVKATSSIQRLDKLKRSSIYLPINTAAMLLAAELWADLRARGLSTAGPWALDADAILAAQALIAGGAGDAVTIATINVRHLGRFPGIDARDWSTIP